MAMVVKIEVTDSQWSTVLEYWKDLKKHLNHGDDHKKKIDFLNRVIFQSAGSNTSLHSQSSINTTIKKTKAAVVAVYDKYTTSITLIPNEIDGELDDMKIDSKMKTFIVEPV